MHNLGVSNFREQFKFSKLDSGENKSYTKLETEMNSKLK